jgi:hypothetical protein
MGITFDTITYLKKNYENYYSINSIIFKSVISGTN